MRIAFLVLLGAIGLLTSAGCEESNPKECAWGEVCAPGYRCHEPTQRCELSAAIAACDGLADRAPCEVPGVLDQPLCHLGVCVDARPIECGNGVHETGEQCDEGAQNSEAPDATCRTDCTPARCGDGIKDSGEGCDEGAGNSDAPDAACRTDCTPARCGDGVKDSGEECEGSDTGGQTCADFGFCAGSLSCSAGCTIDPSGCSGTDGDGDGYGPGCILGEDCDDDAPGVTGPCQANGCPQGWAYIPAGAFEMGCNSGELDGTCQSVEQPRHTVTLSAYCLEVTEVSVGAYRACADAGECTGWVDFCNWSASPGSRELHPVNCIDWFVSRHYCQQWLGGDLPTEAQWEKGARGGPGDTRKYPWGSSPEPDCTRANFDVNGPDAGYGCGSVTTGPGTWEVGSLGTTAGDSPYGLKDMAGNVWEWVQDGYSSSFYQDCAGGCTDPLNAPATTARVFRGGNYYNPASSQRTVFRFYGDAGWREPHLGFRCARTP